MKRVLSAAVALIILGALPAVSSAGASTRANLSALTPAQIVTASFEAANARMTVTTDISITVLDMGVTGTTQSGHTSGEASVNVNGHTGQIVDVGGVLYTRFDATLVNFEFHWNVSSVANKWISITRACRLYPSLALGVALPSVLEELTPTGPLRATSATWNGTPVIALSGKVNATLGLPGGTQTLLVSCTAPYLPLEVAVHAVTSGISLDITIRLKGWSDALHVTAPKVFTPISKTALKEIVTEYLSRESERHCGLRRSRTTMRGRLVWRHVITESDE